MTMKASRALRLAIRILDKQIQRLALDASAYDKFNFPFGKRYSDEKKLLIEARDVLKKMMEEL